MDWSGPLDNPTWRSLETVVVSHPCLLSKQNSIMNALLNCFCTGTCCSAIITRKALIIQNDLSWFIAMSMTARSNLKKYHTIKHTFVPLRSSPPESFCLRCEAPNNKSCSSLTDSHFFD